MDGRNNLDRDERYDAAARTKIPHITAAIPAISRKANEPAWAIDNAVVTALPSTRILAALETVINFRPAYHEIT